MNNFFAELRRRNVVRVAGMYAVIGWILAQVANTLEETMNLPAWFDGLIVALLIVGLPIALIFAWAFELTPEGVKRTEAVGVEESVTARTGRKLDYAIVVGLVVLVAMIFWQQSSETGSGASSVDSSASAESATEQNVSTAVMASVAVLPFADLSPAGDQEYFSDGISEEILNVLVSVEGLEVVSRTSSFQFKGRDLGIPEIAAELKVRHVVEGSVRKAGNTLRITAQLIDAADDRHLWSETYDRPLTAENIFELQDEIANSIVGALREQLGLTEEVDIQVAAPTQNLSAYEMYLQARPMFQARLKLDVADSLLTRALELDPQFAKAWEMRAMLQSLLDYYGFSSETEAELQRRSVEFAQRALAIEPNSASAILAQAKVRDDQAWTLGLKQDIAAILTDYSRAIELEPRNATALNWRGLAYMTIGDVERALQDFDRCSKYEPRYMPCMDNSAWALAALGRDEEALERYLRHLETGGITSRFISLPLLSRLDQELAFKLVTNGERFLAGWSKQDELYRAYKEPGRDHSELTNAILEFARATPSADIKLIEFTLVPLGEYGFGTDAIAFWDPVYSAYRQSTYFKGKIVSSGVFDYWDVHGFPPQCKKLGAADFECL
jgi:TolB-like protein